MAIRSANLVTARSSPRGCSVIKEERAIAGFALAGIPVRILGTGPDGAALRQVARVTQATFYGYSLYPVR